MSGSKLVDAFGGETKLLRAARLMTGRAMAKRAGVSESTVSETLKSLSFEPELEFEYVKFKTASIETRFSVRAISRIAKRAGLRIVKTRFGIGVHQDDYDTLVSLLDAGVRLVTTARAAKILGVSPRCVLAWLSGGLLEASLRRSRLPGSPILLTESSVMSLKRQRDLVAGMVAGEKLIWAEKAKKNLGLNWRQIKKVTSGLTPVCVIGRISYFDAEAFTAEAYAKGFMK